MEEGRPSYFLEMNCKISVYYLEWRVVDHLVRETCQLVFLLSVVDS